MRVLQAFTSAQDASSVRGVARQAHRQRPQPRRLTIAQQKGNLTDDLLDYVTAGPKMRKWYGQAEREVLEAERREEDKDPGPGPEQEPVSSGNAVLVTEADTPIGEQVVLQLILAGAEIKILVRDTVSAKTSYGPYVTPVSIDTSSGPLLKRVLKGCASVVCLGRSGALPEVARDAGLEQLVLLSAAGSKGGLFGSLLDRELSDLRDEGRERAVAASGCRHTTLRVTGVTDRQGGQSSVRIVQAGASSSPSDPVSREDLARVIVEALLNPADQSRVLQVVCKYPGSPPNWSTLFADV